MKSCRITDNGEQRWLFNPTATHPIAPSLQYIRKKPSAVSGSVLLGLVIFGCSICKLAVAQYDSTYVANFDKKNQVTAYVGHFGRSINLATRMPGMKTKSIQLSPNSSAFVGTSIQYKKLYLYLETGIPQTYKVDRSGYRIRSYALFLNHFSANWGITVFGAYNRGLLMMGAGDHRYIGRTDMRMATLGFHHYTIFNGRRYAYAAANSQGFLQKKSAGSFLLMTTPGWRQITSTEGIVPPDISKYHFAGNTGSIKSLQIYSLQLKPGLAYNMVWKGGRYFLAPSVYAGAGLDRRLLQTDSQKHEGFNANVGFRGKLVMGINCDRYFLAAEGLIDWTNSFLENTRLANRYNEISINFGMRF